MKPRHQGKARLFNNPFLEKLTYTPIGVPIIIFVSIAIGLVYIGFIYGFLSVLSAIGLFILGWFLFTLVEYVAHRFVFHMNTDTELKKKVQYTFHGNHHDYPKDKKRLAMPPLVSLLIASGFFFVFRFVFSHLVFGLLSGFLFGYAMYLLVHYAVHAYAPPKNFLKILWIHHSIHHYNTPEVAFGVSSPLWDWIFNTMPGTSNKWAKLNK
ncbi:sterol desaturase family protein [Adhaeribacter aquaticus]|uniref:sterol desaturase family protein n=1 Tax=Adhaeribacter aquaticus TaxID=299567 RepID=UPI000421CCA1|nr:sterol desaturase family protein [Adhaeribacter aquaticus]